MSIVYGLFFTIANFHVGGSFGVVYKGIEKATGETVAIKHVSALVARSTSAY